MGRRIIAVEDILEAARSGLRSIAAPPGESIVTPSAKDKAAELGILLAEGPVRESLPGPTARAPSESAADSQIDRVVREVCGLLKERLPGSPEAASLEGLVREVVGTRLGPAARAGGAVSGADAGISCMQGVCFVNGDRLLEGASGPIPVAEKVIVAEAIRCGEDYKLSGGFMAWEKTSFKRTMEFPEIGVVVEGELRLEFGGQTLTAKKGDMVYFPEGIKVVYSTPGRVKIACVNCIR